MLYTIGFTQTSAENFFTRLKTAGVNTVIDIRLNNRSQLAGFAKYPDIEWFLRSIAGIMYIYDDSFAPADEILKAYQKKEIDWSEYEKQFAELMKNRNIEDHIRLEYASLINQNICFLCSEPTPEHCHRRLVAQRFADVFGQEVKHL